MITSSEIIVRFAITFWLCCVCFSCWVAEFSLVCYFPHTSNICDLSAKVIDCNPKFLFYFRNIMLLGFYCKNSFFKSYSTIFQRGVIIFSLHIFKMIEMPTEILISHRLLFSLFLGIMQAMLSKFELFRTWLLILSIIFFILSSLFIRRFRQRVNLNNLNLLCQELCF